MVWLMLVALIIVGCDRKNPSRSRSLGPCAVGMEVQPGENCTYIARSGNEKETVKFSVKSDGSACRKGNRPGARLLGSKVGINFCVNYDIDKDDVFDTIFSASKNEDNSWRIRRIP